jgi:predicted nicotinamide N-methyase
LPQQTVENPVPHAALIRARTGIGAGALCPEMALYLAPDLYSLWDAQEQAIEKPGLPPPYWALAWAGGQVLSRYVLDHPAQFDGKRVLDIGAGCGQCAIAAAKSGARQVTAADLDPYAIAAMNLNADLNGVGFEIIEHDFFGMAGRWDVVLAADLWYERFLARRTTEWLLAAAACGAAVYAGDVGRAFFPKSLAAKLESYRLCSELETEISSELIASAWRLLHQPRPAANAAAPQFELNGTESSRIEREHTAYRPRRFDMASRTAGTAAQQVDAVNLKHVAGHETMHDWIKSACSEAKRRSRE